MEVFLGEQEYRTFKKRGPRRLPMPEIPEDAVCWFCGESGTSDNKLTWAHRIPFEDGWKVFGLHPDFLDDPINIVIAHQKVCNARVEFPRELVLMKLYARSLELPDYILKLNSAVRHGSVGSGLARRGPAGRGEAWQAKEQERQLSEKVAASIRGRVLVPPSIELPATKPPEPSLRGKISVPPQTAQLQKKPSSGRGWITNED